MEIGNAIGITMRYANFETGFEVDLDYLTAEERKFYDDAIERFRRNAHWLDFDEFAFGMRSPIYTGERSRLAVIKKPLYLALKDMWLQLGVQQGMIRDVAQEGKESLDQRRQTKGSGKTPNQRNSERNRDLAPADSPLNTHRPTGRRGKSHGHGLG